MCELLSSLFFLRWALFKVTNVPYSERTSWSVPPDVFTRTTAPLKAKSVARFGSDKTGTR